MRVSSVALVFQVIVSICPIRATATGDPNASTPTDVVGSPRPEHGNAPSSPNTLGPQARPHSANDEAHSGLRSPDHQTTPYAEKSEHSEPATGTSPDGKDQSVPGLNPSKGNSRASATRLASHESDEKSIQEFPERQPEKAPSFTRPGPREWISKTKSFPELRHQFKSSTKNISQKSPSARFRSTSAPRTQGVGTGTSSDGGGRRSTSRSNRSVESPKTPVSETPQHQKKSRGVWFRQNVNRIVRETRESTSSRKRREYRKKEVARRVRAQGIYEKFWTDIRRRNPLWEDHIDKKKYVEDALHFGNLELDIPPPERFQNQQAWRFAHHLMDRHFLSLQELADSKRKVEKLKGDGSKPHDLEIAQALLEHRQFLLNGLEEQYKEVVRKYGAMQQYTKPPFWESRRGKGLAGTAAVAAPVGAVGLIGVGGVAGAGAWLSSQAAWNGLRAPQTNTLQNGTAPAQNASTPAGSTIRSP